jgi:branched-chain amino acid transport system substrate-binding protein
MKLRAWSAVAALATSLAIPAFAQDNQEPVKVAVIQDSTGPLQPYAEQMTTGFKLGLEYGTKGTGMAGGRKIEVIYKDSQTKPDVGRNLLNEAYNDDHVDLAVGGTNSAVALAMLPVAQENKKILIVEPAVADSITGDKWNRYIFRTGRNSSQDAISNAIAIGKPGTAIATLAQDYAFGRDGVAAFKKALASTGAQLVYEEYAPPATTDFTAPAQRIFDALGKVKADRKIIWVIWAGAGNPLGKLKELDPSRFGIDISTGGNILPALVFYKAFPGMEGATYYYYDNAKNAVNDWLVKEHEKRFNGMPPDFFTCGGFAAAMAVVTALNATHGKTDTETLIAAMEGMKFDTPKDEMIFRKEDHQALQEMYAFKIKVDPNVKWAIPALTRVIKISDMNVPILNGNAIKTAQATPPAAPGAVAPEAPKPTTALPPTPPAKAQTPPASPTPAATASNNTTIIVVIVVVVVIVIGAFLMFRRRA